MILRRVSDIAKSDFVFDADSFFDVYGYIPNNDKVREILSKIDKASYLDENKFIDRNGVTLYKDCLSTSSKILIGMLIFPDKVFYGDELGDNAEILLTELPHGQICYSRIPYEMFSTPGNDKISVEIDNTEYTSLCELNEYLGGLLDV